MARQFGRNGTGGRSKKKAEGIFFKNKTARTIGIINTYIIYINPLPKPFSNMQPPQLRCYFVSTLTLITSTKFIFDLALALVPLGDPPLM